MGEQIDVLKLVGERLDRAGIPYMVCGSMAMNYYAQPRMTRDIDLIDAVDTLDWAYVDRWAADPGVTDLLLEVRR